MNQPLSVEDMCKKLRPVLGPKTDQIFFAWKMTLDKEKKFQIEQALSTLYVKHVNAEMLQEGVFLEPPPAELIQGDYPFGQVSYAGKDLYAFGLREKDFPRHVCITGMSGSGKTNLGFLILKELIEKKKPFIVFDWKYSFRPLLNLDKEILLFTVGNEALTNHFRLNINRPPKGVSPKEWISILADIINESFFASHGVHKLISETMHEAFREFGVYEGSDHYPTWKDIKTRLEDKEDNNTRGREAEWLQSALRIAHSLTFGDFGETINAHDSYSIKVEDILDNKVIFELQALGATEKKFFCEYLLTYIYKLKKTSQKEMTSQFKMAIVVDEAHNIFLKDKTVFMKESVVDAIYREIREYGISLICMDQHISKLSDVVPGNSACNIAFQQMLPQDIQTSSGVMQMVENKNYFSMLPVGTAIVRLAERYHKPFLINVPFMPLSKMQISDEEIILRMDDILRKYAVHKIITECSYEAEEEHDTQNISISGHTVQIENMSIAQHTHEDLAIQTMKEKIERQYEKERRQLLLQLQEKKDKALEEVQIKENGRGRKETQELATPLIHKEHEAVDVLLGPRTMLMTAQKVDPLAELQRKADEAFARELQQKNQGSFKSQLSWSEYQEVLAASPQKGQPSPTSHSQPTTEQQQLLRAIREQPALSISQVYKHLGLSGRKGNRLKDELVARGLINIVEDRNDKGWKKYMRLSPSEALRT
jgi:hypothetical protein